MITTFDLDEYVYPALRYGASGFLLKRSESTLLIEAVRAAMAGDSPISLSITARSLKKLIAPPEAAAGADQAAGLLTVPGIPVPCPTTFDGGELGF